MGTKKTKLTIFIFISKGNHFSTKTIQKSKLYRLSKKGTEMKIKCQFNEFH